MFRSVKNFILAFLKRSEAWKTSFWSFWNVQKHEKLHFGLSETFRSTKNFILAFLKCSEAWKISIWPFLKRSEAWKISIWPFLKRSEAWKTSFWPLCSVQKHGFYVSSADNSLFLFSAFSRLTKNLFMDFLLYLSYLHPMDCCQTPLRQRRGRA